MKNISEMSDEEFERYLKSIKPHLPVWAVDRNRVTYEEWFLDRCDNTALIKFVQWRDIKGKQHTSVACVKWGI